MVRLEIFIPVCIFAIVYCVVSSVIVYREMKKKEYLEELVEALIVKNMMLEDLLKRGHTNGNKSN